MKILKTTLLSTMLFLFTQTAMAEKYEYAIISYKPGAVELMVSINGTEFKKIEVPREEVKNTYFDVNAGLRHMNKMISEGWELFDTEAMWAGNSPAYVFYLRKKVG